MFAFPPQTMAPTLGRADPDQARLIGHETEVTEPSCAEQRDAERGSAIDLIELGWRHPLPPARRLPTDH
jgi:hypothetical protein